MTPIEHALADLKAFPSAAKIQRYREALDQLPQIAPPVEHYFANGLYGRSMFLKAGESVVGARHKTQHFCFIVGDILIYDGTKEPLHVEGIQLVVSEPGAQRVLVALRDTIWFNIHATDLTDIAEIERTLIEGDGFDNRFFDADGTPKAGEG